MDNRKLAQGLRNLPASAREDLAGREQDIQRGKTVELLRRAGKEMYENPIVNTAVGLSPVLGDIQAGVEAYRSAQEGDWGNAGLNAMGMLPFIPMLGGMTKVGKLANEAPQAQALREAEEYGQKMLGLPPGNTPMDRAAAMGFEPTYHGTKTPELVNETGYLIPGGRAGSQRSGDAFGVGVYSTTSPVEASAPVYTGESGAVYPLMIQRKDFLNPENLTAIDKQNLTKFAEESLLPSDKARFETAIKQKVFNPDDTSVAREFFESQQKNAEQFGGGYDRTKPWVDKDEFGNFVVNYTDFDAPIAIENAEDAKKMLGAVGYDAVPSMGYAGHTIEKVGGKKWDVANDPTVLRSRFAAFDPRYQGKPGLLLGAGGLGVYGMYGNEEEYQ